MHCFLRQRACLTADRNDCAVEQHLQHHDHISASICEKQNVVREALWVVAGSYGVKPSGITWEYCVRWAPQLANAAIAASDFIYAEN